MKILLALILALTVTTAAAVEKSVDLNLGWKFVKDEAVALDGGEVSARDYDDRAWETVNVPHTPNVTPLISRPVWTKVSYYRRHLTPDAAWKNKKIFLKIGAGMIITDVWINGKFKATHAGGYQEFSVDLTDDLLYGQDNVITCRLDNRDTKLCPPGRSALSFDFLYFGGLYRYVRLEVFNPLHITDPIYARKTAGGGVFVTYTDVSEEKATVNVSTNVINDSDQPKTFHMVSTVTDTEGKTVLQFTGADVSLKAHEDTTISQSGTVANPHLWSPGTPYLYQLDSKVESGGAAQDSLLTQIGIRTFAFSPTEGFSINGKHVILHGSNRHQEFVYVGNAASVAATKRDAVLVKEAGLNFIRTCHYMTHPAFLEECDKLGVMVMEPIPGWQGFTDTDVFKNACFDAIREMIRRDRNHPSIILWEAALNETKMPREFEDECERIAHEEYPGDQCYTYNDTGHPPYDVIQGGKGNRYIRENGDWGFGGNNSTSRQTRGAGEDKLLQQAWNFACDRNAGIKDPGMSGAGYWCFFDYNRGAPSVETSGVMDLYRLPKFAFYWSQSQRDPAAAGPAGLAGPMVFVANYWSPRQSPAKVVCFSNCEQVELFVNGKSVGKRSPDAGPDVFYNDLNKPGYGGRDGSGGFPWSGGNQLHLAHAAFTFTDVAYAPGEVKAVGYIKGAAAAQHAVQTPGAPAKVAVTFDLQGVPATSNDTVFVRASILDQKNAPVPTDNASAVTFRVVSGPGQLIGTNPINAEAGIATILLRTNGTKGTVAVSAVARGIAGESTGTVTTRDP